jgi:hypothetical protein
MEGTGRQRASGPRCAACTANTSAQNAREAPSNPPRFR